MLGAANPPVSMFVPECNVCGVERARFRRMYIKQCVCTLRPHRTCVCRSLSQRAWVSTSKEHLTPACLPVSMPHHRV